MTPEVKKILERLANILIATTKNIPPREADEIVAEVAEILIDLATLNDKL